MLKRDHNSQQHDDRGRVASALLRRHGATHTHTHSSPSQQRHMSSVRNATQSTVLHFVSLKPQIKTSTCSRPHLSFFNPGKLFQPAPSVPTIHHVRPVWSVKVATRPQKWFQRGVSHCSAANLINVAKCVGPCSPLKAN